MSGTIIGHKNICCCFSHSLLLFFSGAKTLIEKFKVSLVIAAGNDGLDACTSSPGRVKSALTIGASCVGGDPEFCGGPIDSVASWSSIGSCVDLFAPGDLVLSGKYLERPLLLTSTRISSHSNSSSVYPLIPFSLEQKQY